MATTNEACCAETSGNARFALLGWPVSHSVSPQMQGAGFAACGIAASYELIEVHPDDLGTTVRRLQQDGFSGWNVTVPHKQQVIPLLDRVDADAAAVGSVNTVVNDPAAGLVGYSTDGYGLATAVEESFGTPVSGKRFFFVGAGGAARATSIYFARQGAAKVVVANRTLAKAESIVAAMRSVAPSVAASAISLSDVDTVTAEMASTDIVIQATSLGLHEGDALPLSPSLLTAEVAVMDMIYRRTPLLEAAAERGCSVADGRGMLLYQGVRSFEIWTGRSGPVEAMRRGLAAALTG